MRTERKQKILIATICVVLAGGVCSFILAPQAGTHSQTVISLGVSLITAGILAFVLDRTSFSALVGEVVDKLDFAHQDLDVRRKGLLEIATGPFYSAVYSSLACSRSFTLVQTWSPDLTNLLDEASNVVERGGTVRIYLLHPESEFARQRGIDLGPGPKHVPAKIRSDTRDCRARNNELKKRGAQGVFELYYYDALPGFALYGTDDRLWIGTYWYRAQSDRRTTYVIERPSQIAVDYENHLDRLHQLAQIVDLDSESEPELKRKAEQDSGGNG